MPALALVLDGLRDAQAGDKYYSGISNQAFLRMSISSTSSVAQLPTIHCDACYFELNCPRCFACSVRAQPSRHRG
jgi:hypothetical protein